MKLTIASDGLGVVGLALYIYAWHINVALPVTPFAQEYWNTFHYGFPAVSLFCLIIAVMKGHRNWWLAILIACLLSAVIFYSYGDL